MKIALVAEWVDEWRGGAERSTLQFMHHLMDRGAELHLFTRSRPSPTPGLAVHTVNGASVSRLRNSVTFTHRVDRMLRGHDFDIVHAITPCLSATIYQPRGGTVAETIERNVALRRRAVSRSWKRYANLLNFKQRYQLALERKLLGSGRGPIVVAISDYVIDQLKRHYNLPDSRIRKVFNGVDPDPADDAARRRDREAIRTEFGIPDDALLVIQIAHNFRLKGVQCWMEALARIVKAKDPPIRSLVIGKGDAEPWHRLAARRQLGDVLTFTGPTDRVRAFQHAADVLVHPTYYDPCSRVVLEALAAGLPCITTRWDGAAERIVDGQSGFVLDDPADISTLVHRVRQLRSDEVRERMSRAAIEQAGEISMARHTAQMLALYEELAPVGTR